MILPLLLIFVYFVFCNNSKFGTNDFFGKILLICPLLFAQWLDDCLSLLKGLKELDFLAQSSRFHLDNLQIIMIFNCSVMILLCLSLFIFGLFKHKCYLGSNKYMWKISIGCCYLNSHLERESPPITTLTRLLLRFCPRFSMLPFFNRYCVLQKYWRYYGFLMSVHVPNLVPIVSYLLFKSSWVQIPELDTGWTLNHIYLL